jgi:hypothetical protein
MLNEGLIVNDSTALVKSEILNQSRRLGEASAAELQRAVFTALVGHEPDEVDWSIEDNQAGYYTWVRSFDRLLQELIEDGSLLTGQTATFLPTSAEPQSEPSFLVYPPRHSG